MNMIQSLYVSKIQKKYFSCKVESKTSAQSVYDNHQDDDSHKEIIETIKKKYY